MHLFYSYKLDKLFKASFISIKLVVAAPALRTTILAAKLPNNTDVCKSIPQAKATEMQAETVSPAPVTSKTSALLKAVNK